MRRAPTSTAHARPLQRWLRAAVLALLGSSLLAPAAALADRFDPTNPQTIRLEARSQDPRAVVLADGTILAQWFHNESDVTGGVSSIQSCRIPAAATGCDAAPTTILAGGPQAQSALLQPDPDGDPDHVFAVALRNNGDGTLAHYVRESTDGGRSFGASVKSAANPGDQLGAPTYVHGPGVGSFSSLTNYAFQSGQYASGTTTADAKIKPAFSASASTAFEGVGRSDSTTPVAVWETDQQDGAGRRIYTRRFSGSGSVNSAASWTPTATYAPPRGVFGVVGLASGTRGLFVAFNEQAADGCGPRFVVARYDGNGFGAPVPVDADPHAANTGVACDYGNPNAPGEAMAFTQDPAGNLRAVWTFNRGGTDPTAPDGMYTAVSIDGGLSWTNPIRLFTYADASARVQLPNKNGTTIASNAAGDAVVLGGSQGAGAQLTRLPSLAAALAQPGPPPVAGAAPTPPPPAPPAEPAACAVAKFGAVKALATVGCWKKSGTKYSSSGPVRINGIDLKPISGAGARATFDDEPSSNSRIADGRYLARAARADVTEVVLDSAKHTVTTSGAWRASASAVDLGRQAIDWYVPPGGGQVLDDVTRQLAHFDASQIKQRVLGLPVSGDVIPSFLTNGTAQLPMNLQLPDPLGGFSGGPLTDDVTLVTDNVVGINLARGAVSIELPTVSLGIAELDPFKITYNSDPYEFSGVIGLNLPVGGKIDASLLIRDGEFVDATAGYAPKPPIPITGFAYLTFVGLHVHKGQTCADPTKLEVDAKVSAGPPIGDTSLLAIDGNASYQLPEGACKRPGIFRLEGNGSIVDIPVANVYLQYVTDGTLTFGAAVKLDASAVSVEGSIDGGISIASGDFFARGKASVKVFNYGAASVDTIVGSAGIGACAHVALLPSVVPVPGLLKEIDAGVAERFKATASGKKGLTFYGGNCYIGDLVPAVFAAKAQAGAGAVPSIDVAAKTEKQTFVARSAGDQPAPQFTLVGPSGQTFAIEPGRQGAYDAGNGSIAFADDSLHQASITVMKPAAGTWRLQPADGSPAIVDAEGAAGGRKPSVTASVKRARGDAFSLKYRATVPRGTTVTFFDGVTGQALSKPKGGGSGSLRFRSNTGKAGKRTVVARVDGPDGPIAAPVVARFVSKGTPAVGRPGSVRLRRGKGVAGSVTVSWKPATAAASYVIRAELSDGRKIEIPATGGKRSATLPKVPGFASAKVTVFAVSKDHRVGPGGAAKLKAVKAKKKQASKKSTR
jgi:hypothetical protein